MIDWNEVKKTNDAIKGNKEQYTPTPSMAPASTSMIQQQASQAPVQEEANEIFSGGKVRDLFDLLSIGSHDFAGMGKKLFGVEEYQDMNYGEAGAKGISERASWIDTLRETEYGKKHKIQSAIAGFGLDVAIDPLWLLPPVKAAGAVGKIGKALGVTEKLAPQLAKGAKAATKLAETTKAGSYILEQLPAFTTKLGRPAEFVERMGEAERVMGVEASAGMALSERIGKFSKGVQKEMLEVMTGGKLKTSSEEATKVALEAVDFVKDFTKEGQKLGYLADTTVERYFGNYLKKAYVEYETGEKAATGIVKGIKPMGRTLNPLKMRQDKWGVWYQEDLFKPSVFIETADKAERTAVISKLKGKGFRINRPVAPLDAAKEGLTEIKDPAYLLAKTTLEQTKLKEMTKLFTDVSKKWSKSADDIAKMGEEAGGYRLMPEGERWGELSGRFVPSSVWYDLNRTLNTGGDTKAIEKFYATWKANKTVLNPATHFRNMFSNSILNDLGGVPIYRVDHYAKAAKEYLAKGPIYQEAKKLGLATNTYFGKEIKEMLENITSGKGDNILEKMWDGYKNVTNHAGSVYQAEEEFFKLSHYMWKRKEGLAPLDAIKSAEKHLFDYSKVPSVVDKLRKTPVIGSPFITFQYKALPRVAEGLYKKPAVISKYGKAMGAVESLTPKETIKEEQESFRDYMEESGSYLRLPNAFNDENGRSRYLDLGFIFPWGSVDENILKPNTPIWNGLSAALNNKNTFSGEDIWDETDSSVEKYKKFGKYLEDLLAPPLLGQQGVKVLKSAAQTNIGERIQEAILGEVEVDRDYEGRRYSFPDMLLQNIGGLRTQEFNLPEEKFWRNYEKEDEIKELKNELYSLERNEGKQGKSKEKERKAIIRKLEDLYKK